MIVNLAVDGGVMFVSKDDRFVGSIKNCKIYCSFIVVKDVCDFNNPIATIEDLEDFYSDEWVKVFMSIGDINIQNCEFVDPSCDDYINQRPELLEATV